MSARTELNSDSVPGPRGHFVHAVRAGDVIYVSGLLALDGDGQIVAPGDARRQAEMIFNSLSSILAAAGGSLEGLVKLTTYVTDITDRSIINEVRRAVLPNTRPASTLVEVSGLAGEGACVEIDAVALLDANGYDPSLVGA